MQFFLLNEIIILYLLWSGKFYHSLQKSENLKGSTTCRWIELKSGSGRAEARKKVVSCKIFNSKPHYIKILSLPKFSKCSTRSYFSEKSSRKPEESRKINAKTRKRIWTNIIVGRNNFRNLWHMFNIFLVLWDRWCWDIWAKTKIKSNKTIWTLYSYFLLKHSWHPPATHTLFQPTGF